MLGHYVFFQLEDSSEDAVEKLVQSAETLLSPSHGIVFFACGERTADLTRAVNDTQFEVGLQIVFRDRAAHDRYQEAPEHLEFIEKNKTNWAQIRVFDIDLPSHHAPSSTA